MEKIDYLIDYLLNERNDKRTIPSNKDDKWLLYKFLVNIREPGNISDKYIGIENEYLSNLISKKGIIDIMDIPLSKNSNIVNSNIIGIYNGDITSIKCAAIVNPGNSEGLGCFNPTHHCLDNIIGTYAGVCLRNECFDIMSKRGKSLNTSDVFITKGYNLPCMYIIHTVGPIIYNEISDRDIKLLSKCYVNVLEIAKKNGIRTIVFPCISTGLYCFPKDIACNTAMKSVDDYLKENSDYFDRVIFCTHNDIDYNLYLNYGGE